MWSIETFSVVKFTNMPKFYPDNDCNFYVEKLIDYYHNPRLHVLRKNPTKNPVPWFRDQDHSDPNRSFLCSWGCDETFEENTGLKSNKFIKTRLRKNSDFPAAGRPGLWRITRVSPCGFGKLQPHTWNLQDWLEQSSVPKKSNKISKSSS